MKLLLEWNSIVLVAILAIIIPINAYAVDFKDHTEYTPDWALDMGEQQVLMTCLNMEYGTQDQKWCTEYTGYYNDKITKELESYDNQDYTDVSNPNYTPEFNQKLFPETKKVPYNTPAYTNELYGFFILPPRNWSQAENVELLGGEQAAPVGFYSNKANPTYTANFIIVYANLGSGYFDLLRYSSDKDVLDGFVGGYSSTSINSKITNKEIESYLDGYKITIDSVHTVKLNDKKFESVKKESISYILESGDMYNLIFAAMADDFDNNVGEFRKASQTFHVGDVEFEKASAKQAISDSEPTCGKGTILENGRCVVDPNYPNSSGRGGCLIATATFGSELAPQVQFLREIRDNTLLTTKSGTAFMSGFNQLYYSFSPTVADMERENPVLKETVKIILTPMISSLSIMSLADSEQTVLGYGIGVIMLNVGMYFAAPVIVIIKTNKHLKKKINV